MDNSAICHMSYFYANWYLVLRQKIYLNVCMCIGIVSEILNESNHLLSVADFRNIVYQQD